MEDDTVLYSPPDFIRHRCMRSDLKEITDIFQQGKRYPIKEIMELERRLTRR